MITKSKDIYKTKTTKPESKIPIYFMGKVNIILYKHHGGNNEFLVLPLCSVKCH